MKAHDGLVLDEIIDGGIGVKTQGLIRKLTARNLIGTLSSVKASSSMSAANYLTV